MKKTDFSHSNLNGVVSYKGSPVVILTRQGWYPLAGHPEKIYRAAKAAVWSLPNSASAEDLRRELVERLHNA